VFDRPLIEQGVHAAVLVEESIAIVDDLMHDAWGDMQTDDPRFEQLKFNIEAIGQNVIRMTQHHLRAMKEGAIE